MQKLLQLEKVAIDNALKVARGDDKVTYIYSGNGMTTSKYFGFATLTTVARCPFYRQTELSGRKNFEIFARPQVFGRISEY